MYRQAVCHTPALLLPLLLSLLAPPTLWADEILEARGVVRALNRAVISSEIAARITELPKRAGDSFQKGELLVKFDCALFEAQQEKVAAERDAVSLQLESNRQLEALNSIGHLEVALSYSELKKSEAELKISRLNVQRCTLVAPYNGRVVQLVVNEHESVDRHQEVLEIVDERTLEAEILVPALWVRWIKTGQPLQMTIDETAQVLPAEVIHFGAVIDPVSQSSTLRVRFSGEDVSLLPGMSGTARF